MGAQGKSYRYLGTLYDLQNEKDISKTFYQKSGEMDNETTEESGK